MDYGLGLRASGVLDNLFQLLKTFPDLQQFTRQKNATRLVAFQRNIIAIL
jgi:hypothetical protein